MPLLKKTPFPLLEPPKDLEPRELVYQIRFTKEIFRDYQVYLNRVNLYRQRTWTCKVSGKINLTYEEALVSEKLAAEKVQEIPGALIAPALRIIQFSMLSLKDLASTIAAKLQKQFFVGAEVHGKMGDSFCPCKITKVLDGASGKPEYEVAWIDRNKKIAKTATLNAHDLIWKKSPFSRSVLKSFIRESTYRCAPWVLHEKLSQKHGISVVPPPELRGTLSKQNGLIICSKKRKDSAENGKDKELSKRKKAKAQNGQADSTVKDSSEDEGQSDEEVIKYPIDDLLVKPGADDPVFTNRPTPSKDFKVEMVCVGDLLMVWDFCSTFSKLLHLWPFSLEDFENAICHKESNLTLIVEMHTALLQFLAKDNVLLIQKGSQKAKIKLSNWTEYLCDFLETMGIHYMSLHTPTIKQGHYGLLDSQVKLRILRELISGVLEADYFHEKLDESIDQRRMLGAIRREEAIEEAKKKREKVMSKPESVVPIDESDSEEKLNNARGMEDTVNNLCVLPNKKDAGEDDDKSDKRKEDAILSGKNNGSHLSKSKDTESASKKMRNKLKPSVVFLREISKETSRKEVLKRLKDERKEATAKRSVTQRREYFEREIEKRPVRTSSLGRDRDYNRYWFFRNEGRIFVESSDSKIWGYYSSKEELDALMGSLNPKGERERALQLQLDKFYKKICSELQKRAKDLTGQIAMEEGVLRRSTRVRALPKENAASAFLRYVNKWKED